LRDGQVLLGAVVEDDVTTRLMAWLAEQAGAALDRTRQDASAAVDALLRNERERSELVQVLAHDLRSPMTALHGFASLLANHWADFDETRRRDLLEMIQRETGRMDRLVEDVAAAVLGPGTSLPVRLQPVDVTAVLTDLAAAAQAAAPGHTVRAVVAPGTPALQADPDRLDQVVRNLVENATRHTPAGTIVVLYAHRDHDHVQILVADDGPGIPTGIAGRVFERGERGDTAAEGCGLGLHTARTLTEAMGGTLTLDTDLTHGSAFVVRLAVAGPRLG
jgi:signal transduction histidine kinase